MNDLTGELLAAVVAATPERKEAALKVLRGENVSPTPPAEKFVTLKECAGQLGVSACSLWRWKVPGHELGGRRRFRISEVQAYLESDEFKRVSADLRENRKQ